MQRRCLELASVDEPRPGLLRRYALGLWLCGIAALGGIEFARAAFVDGSFAPTLAGWLWLVGSGVCALVGVTLVVREAVGHRNPAKVERNRG
jgi:hypothetical protein